MTDRRPAARALIATGLAALWLAQALPALAQQRPLSASDWLSGSVQAPPRESSAWRPGDAAPPGMGPAAPQPVAESGAVGEVQVTRLDGGDPDAGGTITARRAGLPRDLWQGSSALQLVSLIQHSPARLPAMNALMGRILTAQLTPPDPDEGNQRGRLFLARADRLLDMGALQQAQALLITAGPGDPEVFRRLFDIALLEGDETRACDIMNSTPGIAPSFPARIFCLAQGGDWIAAAISLHGAELMGLINERQAIMLTHFLDDGFVDSPEVLEPAERMTPLDFRIHEAIGQPLPTASLPVAFAQSDLRMTSGWKARLEAAERLARAGAIAPAALRRIYAEQKPAASGGVWERANEMRRLEAALEAGDIDAALPRAFAEFRNAGMAEVLAAMIAQDLPEDPRDLSPQSARITTWLRQWQGLPVPDPVALPDALAEALSQAPAAGPDTAPAMPRGEALLAAMADIDAGLDGDLARAGRGLRALQELGLADDAALAANQLGLLDQMRGTP